MSDQILEGGDAVDYLSVLLYGGGGEGDRDDVTVTVDERLLLDLVYLAVGDTLVHRALIGGNFRAVGILIVDMVVHVFAGQLLQGPAQQAFPFGVEEQKPPLAVQNENPLLHVLGDLLQKADVDLDCGIVVLGWQFRLLFSRLVHYIQAKQPINKVYLKTCSCGVF